MEMKDLKIGMLVIELKDNKEEKIIDLTSNSVLVSRTARTESGINCKNWFTIDKFNKYFKI